MTSQNTSFSSITVCSYIIYIYIFIYLDKMMFAIFVKSNYPHPSHPDCLVYSYHFHHGMIIMLSYVIVTSVSSPSSPSTSSSSSPL